MANLAIRGHATRGKEVIEILEMLGGKNPYNYSADCDSLCFYIGKSTNVIYRDWVNNCYEDEDMLVFTLEEFIEKFPYKVWDKVQHNGATSCGTVYVIERMKWANNHIEYEIRPLHDYNHTGLVTVCAEDLQPFEEETMEQKLEQITLDIPDGYEFFGINDDNKVVLTKTQPQYPKTYVECAKILNCFGAAHIDGYKGELLDKFQELLICRNAYWKIAGEEMGLGKPWEPDWKDTSQSKHSIWFNNEGICIKNNRISYAVQHVLTFPTAAMRDAFYENFKKTIETVKELL